MSNDLIEKVRAITCLSNSTWGTKQHQLYAFLSVFHPELSIEKKLELIRGEK